MALKEQAEPINPIFNLTVFGNQAKMDKMATTGKGGQLPWAKPGIGNGANNHTIGQMRRNGRRFRDIQSRTHRISHS